MDQSQQGFTLLQQSGTARIGRFRTTHGSFDTPNFMPVGTRGSVKGVDVERLSTAGAQIMLVNTYHLWLRPGPELVETMGGIQRFMSWDGPVLSDSGGFQIYSLRGLRKLSEEGVVFQSHLDGSRKFLSPELAVDIQERLGVDIAMVLDECPAADLSHELTKQSLMLTLRWARRALAARHNLNTFLFGITQGGTFADLRTVAAEELYQLPFDGYAIGGLSVGEAKEQMYDVLSYHPNQLPPNRIRYLMGVGTPEDIVEAVRCGVDLFDCVMPTRAGRFGRAYVRGERPYINIKNSEHRTNQDPVDGSCSCLACSRYSRAYIHHLFRVGEMLGPQLLSLHNLTHYLDLMRSIRVAIAGDQFESLYNEEKLRWRNVNSSLAKELA